MQCGLHSWSFRNRFKADPAFDLAQAMQITAEMGFTGMEIMTGQAGAAPTHIGTDSPAKLREIKRHAESLGITTNCLSTYNDFAFVTNEAWRLANIEYIKQWLRLAGEMGVKNIRMLTGYLVDGQDRAHLEDLTRRGIAECVPVAEKSGVNMAIENHSTVFLQADEILSLIEALGSDRVTTCPDPTNWATPDFWEPASSPATRAHVFDSAARLAPRATNAHLKIKGVTQDGHLLGFGSDLDRLLASYRRAGYTGCIQFESIVPGDDLLTPLAAARTIVEQSIARVAEQFPQDTTVPSIGH